MTIEEEKLLLIDLSAKLLYGVKCKINGVEKPFTLDVIDNSASYIRYGFSEDDNIWYTSSEVRPYLFPMSSMTKEQKREFISVKKYISLNRNTVYILFDWLNINHFDHRGLIDKRLAIDCTNLKIY